MLNVWYLDDGNIVGKRSQLEEVLRLLAEEGEKVGPCLNFTKCKVWGPGVNGEEAMAVDGAQGLAVVPHVPWAPGNGLKVLGLPVEYPHSTDFRRSALKAVVEGMEDACFILANMGDPQEQHVLLRFCMDACRVMFFLRGVDCSALQEVVEQASRCVRRTMDDILGHPAMTDEQWAQATLPIRRPMAGLGLKDPMVVMAPARVAGVVSFLTRAPQLQFPPEASHTPSDFVARLSDIEQQVGGDMEPIKAWKEAGKPTHVEERHAKQSWWTGKVHEAMHRDLVASASERDQCRFKLQGMPHTTAWMAPAQNSGVGRRMEPSEYRIALKWWLGMRLVGGDAGGPCPCCGESMDTMGDHMVSCKYNQLARRHDAVRDALAWTLREHGIACRTEVTIGGKMRPGDLGVEGVDPDGPLAIDLVGHHPLSPGVERQAASMGASLAAKEAAKVAKNAPVCAAAGWQFTPLGFHTWGGFGPMGSSLLNRLVRQILGDSQGWMRQHKSQIIWQALVSTIMRYVAQQLLPMTAVRAQCRLVEAQLAPGEEGEVMGASPMAGILGHEASPATVKNVVVYRDAEGWEPAEGVEAPSQGVWCGCLRLA